MPFKKVVIPTVLGGDDGDYAPENGAYKNALVEYEANGALYIYSSDGIFTKLTGKMGDQVLYNSTGNNTDGAMTQRAATNEIDNLFSLANTNTDDINTLGTKVDNNYNDLLSRISTEKKDYYNAGAIFSGRTDDYAGLKVAVQTGQPIYASAEGENGPEVYAVAVAQILSSPTEHIDLRFVSLTDNGDTATMIKSVAKNGEVATETKEGSIPQIKTDLSSKVSQSEVRQIVQSEIAGSETSITELQTQVENLTAQLTALQSATPVFTITSSDPGEGATLADNNFIGVYQ